MTDKKKKGPGRPRKHVSYDVPKDELAAARQKAYRAQKKKRIVEIQRKVGRLEQEVITMSKTDKKISPEMQAIHEDIQAPWVKYTESELMEMDDSQLERIRAVLINRLMNPFGNPLTQALERVIMPSVDREFDSRGLDLKKPPKEIAEEGLSKPAEDVTPKTDMQISQYLERLEAEGVDISSIKDHVVPSSMEYRKEESPLHWKNVTVGHRIQPLFDTFQQMILLYNVEAELSRRKREMALDSDVEQLEKRIEELEKSLVDERTREVKRSYARKMEDYARRTEKKDIIKKSPKKKTKGGE